MKTARSFRSVLLSVTASLLLLSSCSEKPYHEVFMPEMLVYDSMAMQLNTGFAYLTFPYSLPICQRTLGSTNVVVVGGPILMIFTNDVLARTNKTVDQLDVGVSPAGDLILCTSAGIVRCDRNLGSVTPWGAIAVPHPSILDVGDDGYVYVVDTNRCLVRKYDVTGTAQPTVWYASNYEPGQPPNSHPSDLAVDSLGNLYLLWHDRIAKFDASGNLVSLTNNSVCPLGEVGPPVFAGIDVDNQGRIYLACRDSRVYVLTSSFGFAGGPPQSSDYDTTGVMINIELYQPSDVAVDPGDGSLYVLTRNSAADPYNGKILKITKKP